jgi:hypothetical protein
MLNIEGCDSPEAMTETICLSIALPPLSLP